MTKGLKRYKIGIGKVKGAREMRNPRRTKNPKRQKAGQRGGKATFAKYGREYLSELGKRGGRPKSPTLAELQRQQSASKVEKIKDEEERLPNSLNELKKLVKNKIQKGRLAA